MRRLVLAAGFLVLDLAAGYVAFGVGGAAGWRAGWVLALVVLPLSAGAGAWFLLGPRVAGRGVYVAAAALAAVTVAAKCTEVAPESTGRLAQRMDALPLDFYRLERETSSGHGWCRPTCPKVTRTYVGPHVNPHIGKVQVGSALAHEKLLPNVQLLLAERQTDNLRDHTDTVLVRATFGQRDGRIVATITLQSFRPQ